MHPPRHRSILATVAAVGAVGVALILAYGPALRGGFLWDDDSYVTGNMTLRSPAGLARIWTEPSSIPQYYPLVHTLFWFEYRLWGLHPLGFHLVNLLLHGAGAFVLWRVLRRLAVPYAGLAAACFALHPVQVESVAWITERKNVLSGLFYFLALLSYLRFAGVGVGAGERGNGRRSYVLSLVFFLCSLFSKTVAATLPAAILVILWWKRGRPRRADVVSLIPFFACGLLLSAVTIWTEHHQVGAEGETWDLSWLQRCIVAGRAFWFYAAKLAWPADLIFIYPRWEIDASRLGQLIAPLAAAGFLGALWLLRRRITPGPLVAALLFAGTLSPALGFLNVYPFRFSFVADHFQYLASPALIALYLAAGGWILYKVLYKLVPGEHARGWALRAVSVALLLLLSILTHARARDFHDLETLWRDTLRKNPSSWMAHTNLASLYDQTGRMGEALEHYQEAVRLHPDYSIGENNLGVALAKLGRGDEAVVHYRNALRLDPRNVHAMLNLANSLAGAGEREEAASLFRKALELAPSLVEALNNFGQLLIDQGRPAEALPLLQRAVAANPNLALPWINLGRAQEALGQPDAGESYRRAARIDPRSRAAQHFLEQYLQRQARR